MPDLPTPAIPAATLVIFRAAEGGGAPELLMVERAASMAFAAGALVFPGGRVDPGDRELAATLATEPAAVDELAHRIAAVRETVEETGLAVGAEVSAPGLDALRTALGAGEPFGPALAAAGGRLTLDRLEPFARWLPDHPGMRIFDTRFYLARLPADAPAASVDQTENTRLLWTSAAHVLAEADAGRVTIIFPTRRNLERLAQFADHDAAVAQARAYPLRTVTPWTEQRDGRPHLCIPDDLGYPITAEAMRSAMRG